MASQQNQHSSATHCPNCQTPYVPNAHYCSHCGQDNHELKVPIWHLIYEFVENLTHFDTKVWHTVKAIVSSPGKITKDFLEGKRVRYVPPVRLYVFVSVIFFFMVNFFINKWLHYYKEHNSDVFSAKKNTDSLYRMMPLSDLLPDNQNTTETLASLLDDFTLVFDTNDSISRFQYYQLKAGNSDAIQYQINANDKKEISLEEIAHLKQLLLQLPDTFYVPLQYNIGPMMFKFSNEEEGEKFIEKVRLDDNKTLDSLLDAQKEETNWFEKILIKQTHKSLKNSEEALHDFSHTTIKKSSMLMFILMPFVAFLIYLIYSRRRGHYYYEDFIFSLHLHTIVFLLFSIVFAALILSGSFYNALKILAATTFVLWIYTLLSLKKVYGQSWLRTIFKFLLLSGVYLITIIIFLGIAATLGFFTF